MEISPKQFIDAIEQIAEEKNIPKERILETVEVALAAAYRKDFGHPEQHVRAKLNQETGESEVFLVYDVVKEVENPHTEITVAEAKKRGLKKAKVGDELVEKVKPPEDYGRIAAQTAKQVIIQRIREVEREIIQEEFSDKVGELMTGSVQRIEGRNVFVEIGRAIGVLGPGDQIEHERYYIGQRLRVLLREVDSESRGAQLILTRSHPDFVRRLFELEVPEIHAGTVEIKSVAREAGVRTKAAVHSSQEGVDPVGTCVGQRGTRVQAIMAELGEEKIDIVLFDEEPKTYIMNALSPAKISRIELDEKHQTANIIVADDQLSLAIGRGGQNVRLAGELTGWQLDIEKTEQQKMASSEAEETVVSKTDLKDVPDVTKEQAEAFAKAGFATAQQVAAATPEDLAKVEGVEEDDRKKIQELSAKAVAESDEAPPEPAEKPQKEDKKEPDKKTDKPDEPATEKSPEKPEEETEQPEASAETDQSTEKPSEKSDEPEPGKTAEKKDSTKEKKPEAEKPKKQPKTADPAKDEKPDPEPPAGSKDQPQKPSE